ncbi:heterokaryon incompatibility protein-domain-containing protein [Pisolithus marmoratus]|nr:heterokaryon incompatibility protein-domain-containing protein [Pisolithus marmoratus]
MRLIDVVTMINVETSTREGMKIPCTTKILKEFYGPNLAKKEYAILSHCWGMEEEGEEEVLFEDMKQLLIGGDEESKEIRRRTGYKKIIDTCSQAQKDGLKWVWIDTCCINKESSAELSEAINSMYKWYANAKLCYVYLHDTVGDSWTNRRESMAIPKWFSRGWTLQELIAPKVVHFFDRTWEWIGKKADLVSPLSKITQIPENVLKEGLQKALSSVYDSERPSVAQIFSWAADRTVTREEDRAYSLLGLLGVHMPMLYGEGKNAFRRLQLEIIRTSNDQSIFAWDWKREFGWSSSFLADDPSRFRDCKWVTAMKPERFTEYLKANGMPDGELRKSTQKRLRTFTVTNDGIQIWLPTATFGPYSQVTLACEAFILITIHLLFRGSTCCRFFGLPVYPGKMEFQQHLLPYKETEYLSTFTFKLQDQTLSHDSFAKDRVLPNGIVKDGSVTLSSDNDFAAIAYVRRKDNTRFLVLLSYCGGQHSAFSILFPEGNEWRLESLRSQAFERLFNSNHDPGDDEHLTQHIHFPESIQGARVIHSVSSDSPVGCTVTIDIARCFGCCTHEQRPTSELVETPRVPGLMWNCLCGKLPQTSYLTKNYAAIPFSLIESELKLGDYGRVPQCGDKFKPEGNIIEFATGLGLDLIEPHIRRIYRSAPGSVKSMDLLVLQQRSEGNCHILDLRDGTACSLPANQQVVFLLKALSFRLSGRLLVTTVIRCSDRHHLRPRLISTPIPNSHLDVQAWQTLETSTPLCSVMMPLSWCHIDLDGEFTVNLLKIIDNFSVLVGWVGLPLTLCQITSLEYLIGG